MQLLSTSSRPSPSVSRCPITGTEAEQSTAKRSQSQMPLKPFSDVPGPTLYPLLGTIPDLAKNHGGVMWKAHLHYYHEFGTLSRHGNCEVLL